MRPNNKLLISISWAFLCLTGFAIRQIIIFSKVEGIGKKYLELNLVAIDKYEDTL